jgi:hypothetical protein
MWIFTRYGFFSIASARLKDGKVSANKVMVRARQRRHRKSHGTICRARRLHSDHNDYRYRIIVAKTTWTKIVGGLATEQAWSNFKHEAKRFLGAAYDDYVRVLHRVVG